MSFEDLLKQADQGDADAQYIVGKHYDQLKNYPQAMPYCQLSANQNHPKALNLLGWYYQHGCGVVQNYDKAFEYYLLSAEQKYDLGYANVAYCYRMGYGVAKDLQKALEYYRLHDFDLMTKDCELLILKQFSETLNETDYLYAYLLYIKHNHKDLEKLKKLINDKYAEAMHFIPPVLSNIVVSFIL